MSGFIPRIGVALLILLAAAAGFILLGRQDLSTNPSATNYAPPGTSIFAELLRKQGFAVRIDPNDPPKLRPNEVAIVFDRGESLSEQLKRALERHINSGGKILRGGMPVGFSAAVKEARVATVQNSLGKETLKVDLEPNFPESMKWEVPWEQTYVEQPGEDLFSKAGKAGKGEGIVITSALGVTNRYIDQNENARFFVGAVRALALKGGAVVFVDAAAGNGRSPGILETVGNWLRYAWYQVLLCFALMAYTLGRRFGLGVEERKIVGGQRDLVDAMAGIYRRGRAAKAALQIVVRDADRRVRQMAKLPLDVPAEVRDERIDSELAVALREAERASQADLSPDLALTLAQNLRREIEARRRPVARRRAKR